MCKTAFTSNNKLHHHIHFTYSKIKIKVRKTKVLSSDSEFKNISIFINTDVHHTDIVKSDVKNQIDKSDCDFCN